MKKLLAACTGALLLTAIPALADEVRELSAKASEILSKYEGSEEAKSCLPVTQVESIKVLEDRILLVEARGGRYFLNETASRCSGGARANSRLEYSTSTAQLCSGQIIRVVDNTSRATVGSCALGDFHGLTEKPAAE